MLRTRVRDTEDESVPTVQAPATRRGRGRGKARGRGRAREASPARGQTRGASPEPMVDPIYEHEQQVEDPVQPLATSEGTSILQDLLTRLLARLEGTPTTSDLSGTPILAIPVGPS